MPRPKKPAKPPVLCPVCGRFIKPRKGGGAGAPRQYHPECGVFERDRRRLQTSIQGLRFDTTAKSKQKHAALRGELWGLANLLNAAKPPTK